jgi:hypothetical protein
LWQGQIELIQALFNNFRSKQVKNFFEIREKYHTRIINYSYYQAEKLCSIGSGYINLLLNRLEQGLKSWRTV